MRIIFDLNVGGADKIDGSKFASILLFGAEMKMIPPFACLIAVGLLATSCAFMDYHRPAETFRVKLDVGMSDDVSVDLLRGGHKTRLSATNDIVQFSIPARTYGEMRILFVIPAGGSDPERNDRIVITAGGKKIRDLSLNEIRRLPQESDGTRVLKLE